MLNKAEKPTKTHINVYLDADLVAKLKELAERDARSLSKYINIVLKAHYAQKQSGSPKSCHPDFVSNRLKLSP